MKRLGSRALAGELFGEDDLRLNAVDKGAISKASLSQVGEDPDFLLPFPDENDFFRSAEAFDPDDEEDVVELFDSLRLRSFSLSRLELLFERPTDRELLPEAELLDGDLRIFLLLRSFLNDSDDFGDSEVVLFTSVPCLC